MTRCPECDAEIDLDEDEVEEGEILTCGECDSELEVTQTDPGVRGDTASGGGSKPAVVETGAKIQVPLFVNIGDVVRVDTRSGEYVSRA